MFLLLCGLLTLCVTARALRDKRNDNYLVIDEREETVSFVGSFGVEIQTFQQIRETLNDYGIATSFNVTRSPEYQTTSYEIFEDGSANIFLQDLEFLVSGINTTVNLIADLRTTENTCRQVHGTLRICLVQQSSFSISQSSYTLVGGTVNISVPLVKHVNSEIEIISSLIISPVVQFTAPKITIISSHIQACMYVIVK